MKVICIDAADNEKGGAGHDNFNLVEGNIYTVNEVTDGIYETTKETAPCYELKEDLGWAYEIFRFIPLSTIDETELLRERESNLINI